MYGSFIQTHGVFPKNPNFHEFQFLLNIYANRAALYDLPLGKAYNPVNKKN